MTANEKPKTGLAVTPNDNLFPGEQLNDMCHVCHMHMHQEEHVSVYSGSHPDKFQEGGYAAAHDGFAVSVNVSEHVCSVFIVKLTSLRVEAF